MNETEKAKTELQVLARGLSFGYNLGKNEFVHFNRETVVCKGLRETGIEFDVVSADVTYVDGSIEYGIFPYRFVLEKLVDRTALPEYVTLRREDGKIVRKIPVTKFMRDGYEGLDEILDMRAKIMLELLDDESQKFLRVEDALRRSEKNSVRTDYYNAGILLYMSRDKKTPEKVLEQFLQREGYPIEMTEGPRWTETVPTCLEDPTLTLRISIAPDIFGALTEEEKTDNTKASKVIGFQGYNYGKGRVSSLCLQDSLPRADTPQRSIDEVTSQIIPFFLHLEREVIVDPIKARNILRELSQYAQFTELP